MKDGQIMNIIVWLIFGALAGWVASMLMGTDGRQGIIGNIIVGIVGAFIGGYAMQLIGKTGVDGFNIKSFIVAVIGAVILLFVYKAIRGKS
jgi:uncharacterized membrane protein YeaQ/YmgE (transglycosylase-associated protein family)